MEKKAKKKSVTDSKEEHRKMKLEKRAARKKAREEKTGRYAESVKEVEEVEE